MAPIWTFLCPANVDTIIPFSLMCSCNCPAQQVQSWTIPYLPNSIFNEYYSSSGGGSHNSTIPRRAQLQVPSLFICFIKWIIDQSNSPTKDLGAKHTKLEAVENRSNLFFSFPPTLKLISYLLLALLPPHYWAVSVFVWNLHIRSLCKVKIG